MHYYTQIGDYLYLVDGDDINQVAYVGDRDAQKVMQGYERILAWKAKQKAIYEAEYMYSG